MTHLITIHILQCWHWPCTDLPGDLQTARFSYWIVCALLVLILLPHWLAVAMRLLPSLWKTLDNLTELMLSACQSTSTKESTCTWTFLLSYYLHEPLLPRSFYLMNVGIWSLFYDVFVRRDSTTYVTRILWIGQHASPSFVMFVYLQKDVGLLPSFYSFVQLYVDNKSCMQALILQGNLTCLFDMWHTV